MRNLFMACLAITSVLIPVSMTSAQAEEAAATATAASNIHIVQAYAYATMPGSETGAAFMTITNTGAEEDNLIGVKTKAAKMSEIHENSIDPDDGTMMMRKIKSIAVPANGEATLEPTGKHVMLMKLPAPLTLGESFPLTLIFEKAGEKVISVEIIQPGTKPEKTNEVSAAPPANNTMHYHNNMSVTIESAPPQLPPSTNNPVSLVPVPTPDPVAAPEVKIETTVTPLTVTTINAEVETTVEPAPDTSYGHTDEPPAGEQYQRLENSKDVITDY